MWCGLWVDGRWLFYTAVCVDGTVSLVNLLLATIIIVMMRKKTLPIVLYVTPTSTVVVTGTSNYSATVLCGGELALATTSGAAHGHQLRKAWHQIWHQCTTRMLLLHAAL